MSTLTDVISGALNSLGQLGRGQTLSAEDTALGLRRANLLLSQWSVNRLYLTYVSTREYTVVASTASFTIGPSGATYTAARPTFIEGAQVQLSGGGPWLPLNLLNKAQWDAIRTKDAVASIPDDIYVEYTSATLVTCRLNPAPSGSIQIRLGCWEPITQFTEATMVAQLSLPPGYEEALESNLALLLAPDYDQPITQSLMLRAQRGEAAIMKLNAQAMGGSLGESQTLQSPNIGLPPTPAATANPASPAGATQ